MKNWHKASLALAIVATHIGTAHAGPFRYDIQMGSSASFGYSYIHSAASHQGNLTSVPGVPGTANTTVRMGGAKLFSVGGPLDGKLIDTGAGWEFNIEDSHLTATVMNVESWMGSTTAGDVWDLHILGTSELYDANKAVNFGGYGRLDYQLVNPSNVVKSSGSFYFWSDLNAMLQDLNMLGGAPNSLSDNRLDLWGNNWAGAAPTATSGANSLGMDLGGWGHGSVCPMPGNAAGLLSLLATVGLIQRRRNSAQEVTTTA